MQLKSLSIGLKSIDFDVIVNPHPETDADATEQRKIAAKEEPLPELHNAFASLAKAFCSILELPLDYVTGLNIYRIGISYTKHGTRSIQLFAKKQLDLRRGDLHKITTPFVQIDKPADGESGSVDIDKKYVKVLNAAIAEAERYANGERSQKLLDFDQAKAALKATVDAGDNLFANQAAEG